MIYEPRHYRRQQDGSTKSYTVCVADTDLYIISDRVEETLVLRTVRQLRRAVLREIQSHSFFLDALAPVDPVTSHPLIAKMSAAAYLAGVGPMAAVAGAIAEGVGMKLMEICGTVIVENGGDLFISHTEDLTVRLMAGTSSLSDKMGIRIRVDQMPAGLCTSSGTVGHSLSFGKADAVAILSRDTALADAVATATCNRIQNVGDMEQALAFAFGIEGVIGAVAVFGETFGAIGDIQLVQL